MKEYEVEVFLSGSTVYSILADNEEDAENLAREKLREDLSSRPVSYIIDSTSAILVDDDSNETDPDDNEQIEEEDQWNGPKR